MVPKTNEQGNRMADVAQERSVSLMQRIHFSRCDFKGFMVISEDVTQGKHKVGIIFCLVFEANPVQAEDTFFIIQVFIRFNGEGE